MSVSKCEHFVLGARRGDRGHSILVGVSVWHPGDVFLYLPIPISWTHTWYFHNEEFHGASGWPKTEKSCLWSHMQERERGDSYATEDDVTSGEGPAEVTSSGSSPVQNQGDTPVMSSNSVERRREIFGAVVAEQKTDKSDYILLNMHPRFITQTHTLICCPYADTQTHRHTHTHTHTPHISRFSVCVCLFRESSALPIARQFAHPHGVI